VTDSQADPERQRLVRSIFEPSSLDEVAEAVSVATKDEKQIYVERIDSSYRWSLTHRGGLYPLLRIAARFLRVDYHCIFIGFRNAADGVYILSKDPAKAEDPDAWTVIDFDGPTEPEDVKERIVRALAPRRDA
jgi:hypothetical protein